MPISVTRKDSVYEVFKNYFTHRLVFHWPALPGIISINTFEKDEVINDKMNWIRQPVLTVVKIKIFRDPNL